MNDTSHDTSATTAAGHEPTHAAGRPPSRQSVYDVVTTRILELLERGTVPWRSGWTRSPVGAPRSASTGKVYRGINHFPLAVAAQAAGYTRSSWITFRQAKELGGSVRKGENGMPYIFWRVLNDERDGGDGGAEIAADGASGSAGKRRFVLRYYTVFNVHQCDGLPESLVESSTAPEREIIPCRAIVSG